MSTSYITNDIYIIKVDEKPIFASTLFVEFENKKKEIGSGYTVEFRNLSEKDHFNLLGECSKNIIELNRKRNTLNMTDKS